MVDRNTALAFAVGAVTGAAAIHTVLNVTRSKPASETSSFGSPSSKHACKAFVDDADEDADGVAELEQLLERREQQLNDLTAAAHAQVKSESELLDRTLVRFERLCTMNNQLTSQLNDLTRKYNELRRNTEA